MDDLLIAVVTSKGLEGYRTLFENLAPRVKSFLLGNGTRSEVAEEAAQEANRIRERVAALPAEQQEVLRLAFFKEVAHSEILQWLGILLGTAKSRIRLAVRRIRNEIGESECVSIII